MTDGTGTGSTVTQTFSYEGARRDAQGRGFLGFARRVVTDTSLGYNLRTEVNYSQVFPYLGLVTAQSTKQASGTQIQQLNNTWSALTLGSGYEQARYPYLSSSSSQSFELGGAQNGVAWANRQQWASAIDSTSGQVTDRSSRITESFTGLYTNHYRTERIQLSNLLNDTTNWCLGRAQTTVTTASHTLPGGAAIVRTEGTTWDSANCRPHAAATRAGQCAVAGHLRLWLRRLRQPGERVGDRRRDGARNRSVSFGTRGQFPELVDRPGGARRERRAGTTRSAFQRR